MMTFNLLLTVAVSVQVKLNYLPKLCASFV